MTEPVYLDEAGDIQEATTAQFMDEAGVTSQGVASAEVVDDFIIVC